MDVKLEIDNELDANQIIITANAMNQDAIRLLKQLNVLSAQSIILYKRDQEYVIALKDILFFETDDQGVFAHTVDDAYNTKYRLYELEETLPKSFIRISKSTILNIMHLYAIDKSIASSSRVLFRNTHKQVYISRRYYKQLKLKLAERSSL